MAAARAMSDVRAQPTKFMLGVAALGRALTKATPQVVLETPDVGGSPHDLCCFSALRFEEGEPKPLFSCAIDPSLRILPIAKERYQRAAFTCAIHRDQVFEAISRLDDGETGRFDFGGARIGHASVLGPKPKRDLATTLTKKLMARDFNPFNVELWS
jgi:hypothetical protein